MRIKITWVGENVWLEVVMRTKVFIKDYESDGHESEKFYYDYKFIKF